jgi:prepilin-type N-terminal cleavage/methylation domain-containing protein
MHLAGKKKQKSKLRGFTLLELLAVVLIVGILAAMTFSLGPVLLRAFEKTRCMANLKSLHFCLGASLADLGHWPQLPEGVSIDSEEEDEWWRKTLKPYGMTEKAWYCPTLLRSAKERNIEQSMRGNHYVPALFDNKPMTPTKWDGMPWAMEIGNNHGSGLLIVNKNGEVMGYEEFKKRR